jgi:hypothetical protein
MRPDNAAGIASITSKKTTATALTPAEAEELYGQLRLADGEPLSVSPKSTDRPKIIRVPHETGNVSCEESKMTGRSAKAVRARKQF